MARTWPSAPRFGTVVDLLEMIYLHRSLDRWGSLVSRLHRQHKVLVFLPVIGRQVQIEPVFLDAVVHFLPTGRSTGCFASLARR